MQKEPEPWRLEEDCPPSAQEKDFTCDECGRTFQEPILATVSTSGQTQTYYACPRCMTKIQNLVTPTRGKKEKSFAQNAKPEKPRKEAEGDFKCGHFFGYLGKREKSSSFPEECLTCPRMVECMIH